MPVTPEKAEHYRRVAAEAVRLAVHVSSIDEGFGIVIDDPVVVVSTDEDALLAVACLADRVTTGFAIRIDPEVYDPEVETELSWQHETRTGRSYECAVRVLVDTEA